MRKDLITGALAIALGLGFWLGLLAMVIGTVLGSLVVGYLSTWGPRTGAAQLPNSRMAFGGGVVLPGALQWLSSIAWDAHPNRAPCTSWRTCGREYHILEYDVSGESWKLLRDVPALKISSKGVAWIEGFEQTWAGGA